MPACEQAILADTFPPKQHGQAFALYAVAVLVAPTIGPTLGGWITDNFSWHWIFFINVPIGIVSLALVQWLVNEPEALERERQRRLALLWQNFSGPGFPNQFFHDFMWSAFGGPTMLGTTSNWEDELRGWLKPFLDRLGHKARRRMCPLYVAGLIGPGDRKSVQPMAERLAPGGYDQLHHFVSAGVWNAAPLETELLIQADRLVGGSDAVLVIDDTAVPKKGTHSVEASLRNMLQRWARPPTVKLWCH